MAGRVVNVIPRTSFAFNGTASSISTQAIGPRAIATPDWVGGVLMVRVHSATISTTASIAITVKNVSISPDDPNILFNTTTTNASISLLTGAPAGNVAGGLQTAVLTTPIGSMLAVYLTLTQGATAGASTVDISVDLVGRDQLSIKTFLGNKYTSPEVFSYF